MEYCKEVNIQLMVIKMVTESAELTRNEIIIQTLADLMERTSSENLTQLELIEFTRLYRELVS